MGDPFFDTLEGHARYNATQRDFREHAQRNALARQAGGYLANGDTMGARNALFAGGEIDQGLKLDEGMAASRKTQAEALDRFTTGLGRMMDDPRYANNPDAAWAAASQFAPQLGLDADAIQKHRDDFLRDPKGFAMFWNGKAKEELEFAKSSDGSYSAIDKHTGQPVYQYQAPTQDKYEQFDPEKELRRIPGRPGSVTVGGQAPEAEAAPQGGNWLAGVARAAPDAQVTSGLRTPQHNAAVGGQPNSRHLSGQAVDLVPRPGETMGQLYARVSRVPGVRAINEGDHVHVQQTGQAAAQTGGPEVVRAAQPKPQKPQPRPATVQEKAAYNIAADVPAQIDSEGNFRVITGTGAANKRVPQPIQKGYIENNSNIAQIDRAIALVKANKGAMGMANVLGDEVRQRLDPGGIKTRAAVAEVGAVKIHDLSGAAVTAAETPRLKPFVPMPTDNADATIAKLEQLKDHIRSNNGQIEAQYGEESGYMPLTGQRPAAPAAPAAKAQASGSPPASALKPDHITTFANGQKWTLRGGKPVRVQ